MQWKERSRRHHPMSKPRAAGAVEAEVWMMVLVDRMYASPASSIGFVTAAWRASLGKEPAWPAACYGTGSVGQA